jgi:molybdopterin adenylyltransferase
VLTVSDRVSRGADADRGGPAAEDWLRATIITPVAVSAGSCPTGPTAWPPRSPIWPMAGART